MTRFKMRWAIRGIAAAAVLSGAWGVPAFAEDLPVSLSDYPRIIRRDLPEVKPGQEMRLGALRLHPSFQTAVEQDDNVRLSSSNKQDDVIFTQMPGMLGEVRMGDHRMTAGYWAEVINFAEQSEENAVNHIVNGDLRLNFNHLKVDITELMEKSTSRLFDEDSSRKEVLLNTAGVRARLERPRWVFEGGYKNNLTDYRNQSSVTNDRDEGIVSMLAGRKMAPKTTLFVEGAGGRVDYDSNVDNADHEYWQVMGGAVFKEFFQKMDAEGVLVREPQARMTATFRACFQRRQLSDVSGRGSQKGYRGLVADASFLYRPTVSDAATVGYSRTIEVSTFGPNEWYRQDKVSLSWKKRLLRKFYAVPRFSWQRFSYPELHTVSGETARREDDHLQFQGELRYEPRVNKVTGEAWAWVSLFYTFRNRESNFDSLDFDNNKVGLKVGFVY